MKRLLLALILVTSISYGQVKISDLSFLSTWSDSARVVVTYDSSGTKVSRQMYLITLKNKIDSLNSANIYYVDTLQTGQNAGDINTTVTYVDSLEANTTAANANANDGYTDSLQAGQTAGKINTVMTSFDASGDLDGADVQAGTIPTSKITDGDKGDVTVSSGAITLDNDVVSTAEMADADHGDFTYSGGSATLDAGTVAANELASSLDFNGKTLSNLAYSKRRNLFYVGESVNIYYDPDSYTIGWDDEIFVVNSKGGYGRLAADTIVVATTLRYAYYTFDEDATTDQGSISVKYNATYWLASGGDTLSYANNHLLAARGQNGVNGADFYTPLADLHYNTLINNGKIDGTQLDAVPQSMILSKGINNYHFLSNGAINYYYDPDTYSFGWDGQIYIVNDYGGYGTLAADTITLAGIITYSYINFNTDNNTAQGALTIQNNGTFWTSAGGDTLSHDDVIILSSRGQSNGNGNLYVNPRLLQLWLSQFVTDNALVNSGLTNDDHDTIIEQTPLHNFYPQIYSKLPNTTASIMGYYDDTIDSTFNIIVSGNSLFARETHTSDVADDSSSPPGLITQNIARYLWDNVPMRQAEYRRYDYGSFFTETGTWGTKTSDATWDDNGDRPVHTRTSTTASASIEFTIAIDYDRFALLDRTETGGSDSVQIAVTGGDGLVQVRYDTSSTWSEANGFIFSQKEVDDGVREGNTIYQRRIQFKKLSSASRTITITNLSAQSEDMLYWGLEMWDEPITRVINTARGGHTLSALYNYMTDDIINRMTAGQGRNLLIIEIPLINMLASAWTKESSVNWVHDFVWGDRAGNTNTWNLKTQSSNWTNFEVLLVIPHHPRAHFNSDGTWFESGGLYAKEIYQAVKSLIYTKGDVGFVDMSTAFIREIEADPRYSNYYTAITGTSITGVSYTADNTHQNDKGTLIYVKHLIPIFDFNTN